MTGLRALCALGAQGVVSSKQALTCQSAGMMSLPPTTAARPAEAMASWYWRCVIDVPASHSRCCCHCRCSCAVSCCCAENRWDLAAATTGEYLCTNPLSSCTTPWTPAVHVSPTWVRSAPPGLPLLLGTQLRSVAALVELPLGGRAARDEGWAVDGGTARSSQ